MKTDIRAAALAALLAALLLAGCGSSGSEAPAANQDTNAEAGANLDPGAPAANLPSKPGDVITSQKESSTSAAPSCEGVAEFKITLLDNAAPSATQILSTTAGSPVKISVTTLEPIRVQLPGSQFILVHAQRGVNLLCLLYASPGKYDILADGKVVLVVEVSTRK